MINKGQIITIMHSEYIDFPGGTWKDHFTDKKKFLLVIRGETNNGNMLCKDSKGKLYHVNRLEVTGIIK